MSPQSGSDRLSIEKRNACPNNTRIIHNVQFEVGNQNKETKIKKNPIFYSNSFQLS